MKVFRLYRDLTPSTRNFGRPSHLDAAVCRSEKILLTSVPAKSSSLMSLYFLNKKFLFFSQEPFCHKTSWFFFIMSRFLLSRRGLLHGADCTWVSLVSLYPGWFFDSNFNYVRQLPSTPLYATVSSSCHERPILIQGLSQVINRSVSMSSLDTLFNKTNEMKLIKKSSYYHFNIILPSNSHAFQLAFSSHFVLSNMFYPFLTSIVLSTFHLNELPSVWWLW